jgi:hypothetical protein
VNEVVTLADTVTGGGRAPLAMEFVRLFQTLSAINESWGRGASADCNIIKPCGGCFVQIILNVNRVSSIDPATQFAWRLEDDFGNVVAAGVALGSEFRGTSWINSDTDLIPIDGTVNLIAGQIAGPVDYCELLMTATVFSEDTLSIGGFYNDCLGVPNICYPRFDCSGDLFICEQG